MSLRQMPELQCATALAGDGAELSPSVIATWNPLLSALAADESNVVSILQPIGAGLFTDGFTAQRMAAALRSIGERDVVVHMNSPGGRVDEGTAIYNMLRQHKAKVTVKILGMAGSIASVIAMAGDSIEIAKAGTFFVHNSEAGALGNRHVHDEISADLQTFDEMMAMVYADRTGLSTREIEKLMDGRNNGGTLLNSTVSIEKGFADALLPGDAVKTVKAETLRGDILAVRRLEALATSPEQASRTEFKRLMKEIKAGLSGRETGTPGAAEDTMPGAGVHEGLMATLAEIDIPLTARG